MEMLKEPSIPQVLDGENILITGGTGYIGKLLLEKILRCCPGVDRVYLIVRSKRGDRIENRIESLLSKTLFDRCRAERGDIQWCCRSATKDFPRKNGRKGPIVVGIAGDIAEAGLGLSDEDRSELESHVSVVFHSAATVKFNDPLRQATLLNTRGTRDMLKLANKMSNLKVFVHMSTAFAHSTNHHGVLEERFYSVPMEPEVLIKAAEELDDEEFQKVLDRLGKVYENSYLCTKAMAERIIENNYSHLPVSIYRPAVVGGIHKDPIPGWVEGTQVVQKIVYGSTSGLIGTLLINPDIRLEYVPADHVVSAMLAVAWEALLDQSSQGLKRVIRIYNHVSDSSHPLKMEIYRRNVNEVFAFSKGNRSYSQMKFTMSTEVYEIYSHLRVVCARVMDALESSRGKNSNMAYVVQRGYEGMNQIQYFLNHEFVFSDAKLKALWKRCSAANTEKGNDYNACSFNFDNTNFSWDPFLRSMLEYLKKDMNEDNSSIGKYLFRAGQIFRLAERVIHPSL